MSPSRSLPRPPFFSAYAVASLLVILPLLHVGLLTWPPRPSQRPWRVVAVGLVGNALLLALLGTALVLYVAFLLDHWRLLRLIASIKPSPESGAARDADAVLSGRNAVSRFGSPRSCTAVRRHLRQGGGHVPPDGACVGFAGHHWDNREAAAEANAGMIPSHGYISCLEAPVQFRNCQHR